MRPERYALLGVMAAIGLALPPPAPAQAAGVVMTLCSGGTVMLVPAGKRGAGDHDRPAACHAACALRRDDDDGRP